MARTGKNTVNAVLTALRFGQAAAIHQTELAAAVGVSNARIKQIIRDLRQSGFCIISDESGYYMAETREEVRRFIGSMSRQAATRFGSISGIKKAAGLNEIDGQMDFTERGQGK